MSAPLYICSTGTANIASVLAAFRRLGCAVELTESAELIREAHRVLVPGVGTFAAALGTLAKNDMVEALRERVRLDRPTCGICVGMQLLFKSSEESPGVAGLGVFEGNLKRFPSTERVPQMGWNKISPAEDCKFLLPGYVYFANSYYLPYTDGQLTSAWADYGGRFVAGVEHSSLLACQFHPELSGELGSEILNRWLQEVV